MWPMDCVCAHALVATYIRRSAVSGERADINYLHISCSSYVIVPFTIRTTCECRRIRRHLPSTRIKSHGRIATMYNSHTERRKKTACVKTPRTHNAQRIVHRMWREADSRAKWNGSYLLPRLLLLWLLWLLLCTYHYEYIIIWKNKA